METIKQLISGGNIQEALRLLDDYLVHHKDSEEAWFLRGNAYRKIGETRLAINSYLEAIALNPQSPAQEAYNMMIKILDFYNKDMYNH